MDSPSLAGEEATLELRDVPVAHTWMHGGSVLGLGEEAPRGHHIEGR